MTVQALQVPPIGTNCYLLKDDQTGKGAIIDPGGNAPGICQAVGDLGMAPAAILLTHGHYDHTGAVTQLRQAYPGIPVYLHPKDAEMMVRVDALVPDIGETVPYDEGDQVSIGDLTVRVLHTPGHTPGSVTLEVGDVLFTGDTLFQGSCGRTDLAGGAPYDMLASLKRLGQIEGDRQVCPGHEGRSTLEQERRANCYMLQALNA
jgi:glyoxylase-like metal-dependent hydrolase (beta-lactamase superfamily II)